MKKLLTEEKVDRESALWLEQHIRRMEMAVTNHLKYRWFMIWSIAKRVMNKLIHSIFTKQKIKQKSPKSQREAIIHAKKLMAEAAIQQMKKDWPNECNEVAAAIIEEYNKVISSLRPLQNKEEAFRINRLKRELQIFAFQAERNELQRLYENKEVSLEVIRKLRQQINIREVYWMEENQIHSS